MGMVPHERHHPSSSSSSSRSKRSRKPTDILLASYVIPERGLQIPLSPEGQEIIKGRGRCGRILKGHSLQLGTVAVKVISLPDDEARPTVSQAYSHLQTSIRGSGMVKFHAAFQQGPNMLIITQYMPGKDLRSAMTADKRRRLHWNAQGGGIALQVAKALRRLHSHGVSHRHLKSSNVLLSHPSGGKVAVADAGLAALLGADISDHGATGSFAWAAPELLLSERCTVQADIYSFGVLLWELVTQEVPLRGKLRPPMVPAECPAEVVELVGECLDHDPLKRPTAAQVCERLGELCPLQAGECQPVRRSISLDAASSASSNSSGGAADRVEALAQASAAMYDSNLQAAPGRAPRPPPSATEHSRKYPDALSPPNPFEGVLSMSL